MSGLTFKRHLLAAVASLLMSSIAVGTAIAPGAVAHAAPATEIVTYA